MKQGFSLSFRAAIVIASASLVGLVAGCGNPTKSDFTLSLSVDDTTLTADGSDSATVRVSVLDDRGYPPPIGSRVLLQAQNGEVNSTDQNSGDGLTDASGTAQFTVSCAGESDVQVIAVYEGYTGFLMEPIDCGPAPSGDWEVLISASPRSVAPGGSTTVTVDAVTGAGTAVPQGTGILFTINEPNPGARFRFGGATSQINTTQDPSGRISVVALAPPTDDNFTICAGFADSRFGAAQRCLTIQVGSVVIDEATCLATYAPSRISGDGQSTSLLTFSVFDDNGQAVDSAQIEAFIELGEFLEDPDDPGSGVGDVLLSTDSAGLAEVTILAPTRTGTAGVEATADFEGLDAPLECIFQESLVYFPPPTCEFDDIGVLNLGASRSIRVCYTDFDAPVPSGRRVDFELVSAVGGTTLTASTAFTDDEGCATTGIATGQVPGGLTISASMPFGRTEAVCQSTATVQHGGLESANQLTVSCGANNLGVYLTRNETHIVSSCSVVCQASVLDQFHNPVEGAAVYFTSETGGIDSVGITNAAGIASTTFYPRGWIPLDVPKLADEPDGLGGYPMNPRDSLVTIVASTVGQEMFNDDDGDGVYDDGEYFVDLPEPFVDADDDDTFDPDGAYESFTDAAVPGRPLNGEWDGPNGVWDAYTQIWGTTHILYSGAAVLDEDHFVWTGTRDLDGLPNSSGIVEFYPVDVFGVGMSSATTFTASTTCGRADAEIVARQEGDLSQVLSVGSRLRNFIAGAEVAPESPMADYGIFGTVFDFDGTDTEHFGGPYVWVGFTINDDGPEELCSIQIDWTEGVSDDCSDVAIENTVALPVHLPSSF